MIENAIIQAVQETSKEVINSKSSELPSFVKDMKDSSITNYEQADTPIGNIETTEKTIIEIDTRNQHLEGETHPETGVPFERKQVEMPDGTVYEGVYPVFDSKYDVKLPEDMYLETDREQFKYAIEELKNTLEEKPELKKNFNETELEQIEAGETPDNYVWHHSEETGKLQLVDEEIHAKTGHSGGRSTWGGGSEFR